MIVKLDNTTETELDQVAQEIAKLTGIAPQSMSLVVQALIQWACKHMNQATLRSLAPHTLSLAQQRKAVIGQVIAYQRQMDQHQLKALQNALVKLKASAEEKSSSVAEKQD